MKNKRLFFVFSALFIAALFLDGCANNWHSIFTTLIPNEYIVEPNRNNPYQGTWLQRINPDEYGRNVIVIEGANFKRYQFNPKTKHWTGGETVYNFNQERDRFRISEDNNFLYVANTAQGDYHYISLDSMGGTYERYK